MPLVKNPGKFQWAPTLGGECYHAKQLSPTVNDDIVVSMGTHPWG